VPDFVEGIGQFLDSFSADEVAVTRAAFQGLLEGRAAGPHSLSVALGLSPVVVERVVARLVERGRLARDPGTAEIVGARGLSLTETPHRLVLGGRRLYAFCAVDAVGIPAALELDARVESHCHGCGRPLVLALTRGVVTDAPAGIVVWAAERDPTRPLHTYT
jgi:alkylmercury lyase